HADTFEIHIAQGRLQPAREGTAMSRTYDERPHAAAAFGCVSRLMAPSSRLIKSRQCSTMATDEPPVAGLDRCGGVLMMNRFTDRECFFMPSYLQCVPDFIDVERQPDWHRRDAAVVGTPAEVLAGL